VSALCIICLISGTGLISVFGVFVLCFVFAVVLFLCREKEECSLSEVSRVLLLSSAG
jgi:hypothetical protein